MIVNCFRKALSRIVTASFAVTILLTGSSVSVSVQHAKAAAQAPIFGPYEQVRQHAHAYCVQYLQGGDARAYLMCLQQFAAYYCSGISDFLVGLWCTAAATTPYPAPGQRLLTARSYRVEVTGGWHRDRDPQTGVLVSERPLPPALAYTLERQPNGLYLSTVYELTSGQVANRFWVNDRCEITDAGGQPIIDFLPCPLFPNKPYLVTLIPPPQPHFPPQGQVFSPGRLLDDFDGDGIVEIGYLHTSGSGGRSFTSGSATAFGYEPDTRAIKFEYRMAARESDSPATTYFVERLYRFRAQSAP